MVGHIKRHVKKGEKESSKYKINSVDFAGICCALLIILYFTDWGKQTLGIWDFLCFVVDITSPLAGI